MNISFVGGGVMAEALMSGILDADISTPGNIKVGEPNSTRRNYLTEKYSVNVYPENIDAIQNTDIIILAVKPQNVVEVMSGLTQDLTSKQTVLSIVAGTNIPTLKNGLNHNSVIRVMPNTPAQIRAGMTVWTASEEVTKEKLSTSKDILKTLGEELYVDDENLIDMATALSASGPAYVFLFIEALIDSGVYMGLPRDVSRKLVLQTIQGSTRLVQESGQHPAVLKDMVSSPGGGTVEALMTFEQSGFHGIILEAVVTAYEKYQSLGKTK